MPQPTKPTDEVLRDLDARAAALSQRTARPSGVGGVEGRAADQAYRLIAELVGGVLVGLGLGFALDRLTHGATAPWGLIGGVLVGFAGSLWMAKQTADRLSAQATAETSKSGPPVSGRFDEDD